MDKIEASRQILARSAIAQFYSTLNPEQKPGRGVEVEFGNALIREVHNKLLADGKIKKPWLGIPQVIAYEDSITDKLTQDVIAKTCAYIEEETEVTTPGDRVDIAQRILDFRTGGADGMDPPYKHIALAYMQTLAHNSKKLTTAKQQVEVDFEAGKVKLEEAMHDCAIVDNEELEEIVAEYNSLESEKEDAIAESLIKVVRANTRGRKLPTPPVAGGGGAAPSTSASSPNAAASVTNVQPTLPNSRQVFLLLL